MTTSNKIIALILLTGFIAFVALVIYGWIIRHFGVRKDSQPEVVKVEDISIGHAIYDLFPEWEEEFKTDPMMDEIAATCDMYLVLKEIQKYGKISHKLAVMMNDAIVRFEKSAL